MRTNKAAFVLFRTPRLYFVPPTVASQDRLRFGSESQQQRQILYHWFAFVSIFNPERSNLKLCSGEHT
jgi:hypothetical protein